jgi:hypothetical protein
MANSRLPVEVRGMAVCYEGRVHWLAPGIVAVAPSTYSQWRGGGHDVYAIWLKCRSRLTKPHDMLIQTKCDKR